jgi:hypothetical protein
MRTLLGAAALLLATAGPAWSQIEAPEPSPRLELAFEPDGRVRLAAARVSVRDVLAEWARLCGCYVVNADRLASAPLAVPILFESVPQAAVLRSLLKEAGGYVLTPRRPGAAGPSVYETIYVLSARPPGAAASYVIDRPAPQPAMLSSPGSPDDEIPPVRPVATPEAVDPSRPNPPPTDERRGPGVPGVTVPGVRIVPITPIAPGSSAPQPPGPPPATPGR